MKAFASAILAMFLLGCASLAQLGPDEIFSGQNSNPNWSVSLNRAGIYLDIGSEHGRHSRLPYESFSFPMVSGRRIGDAFVWEATGNGRHIVVESRRARCVTADG